MGIGKSKHTQMDIDGLMNGIDTDRQIEQEAAATDKRLEELREAQTTLKEASESLRQATAALHEAVAALNEAKANAGNVTADFNKAIVDAQENTKFKVSFEREDLEQMSKLSMAALKTDEIMIKQLLAQQVKDMEEHQRKISKILRRNEGVWLSDFWSKVLTISLLVFSIVVFLYVQIKT